MADREFQASAADGMIIYVGLKLKIEKERPVLDSCVLGPCLVFHPARLHKNN